MIWETDPTVKNDLQKTRLIFSNFFKRMAKKEFVENIIPLDLISGRFKKDHEQQLEIEREFRNLILRVESLSKEEATHNNVSFTVYLKEKIGFGLRNEILKLQHSTSLLNNVFSRLKPELLMGMYSVGIYYMMGEFSHRMDFVSLNISHGTHVPPNNKFEEIENYCLARTVILNTYKHVAVQTPWADKFLDYYKDERPRVYSGPLLYSVKNARARVTIREQVLGKGNNARIIVHASTQKTRDSLRFHIEESLDEYICSLSDIVNAVNKLDDVYFIIRPHPICDISEEEFAELLPSCRRLKVIKKKRPFSDILSIADLLISYSSTCIEEALQSNIPVILFDRWRRYNHFNLEETKSENQIARNAAYYITRPEILPKAIPGILDIYDKEPLGDEELLNYKYPADYRSNFYSFVKQALGRET